MQFIFSQEIFKLNYLQSCYEFYPLYLFYYFYIIQTFSVENSVWTVNSSNHPYVLRAVTLKNFSDPKENTRSGCSLTEKGLQNLCISCWSICEWLLLLVECLFTKSYSNRKASSIWNNLKWHFHIKNIKKHFRSSDWFVFAFIRLSIKRHLSLKLVSNKRFLN